MNNRDILILGAIILVGAIAVELYTMYSNPFIGYAPGSFSSLLMDTPQRFGYYKDGALIGNYTYTLTKQTSGSQTLYTLDTNIDATYQGARLNLKTIHMFLGETSHVGYTVDTDLAGSRSNVKCIFLSSTVGILTTSQGRNLNTTLMLPSNTVLIDNNDPAHWELLMKSFTVETGKRYNVNTLVPQGAVVRVLEFGVDTAHQFVSIGTRSYECVVAREPNYEITLYFYQGNLIQYKNDADGILIVKQIS